MTLQYTLQHSGWQYATFNGLQFTNKQRKEEASSVFVEPSVVWEYGVEVAYEMKKFGYVGVELRSSFSSLNGGGYKWVEPKGKHRQ